MKMKPSAFVLLSVLLSCYVFGESILTDKERSTLEAVHYLCAFGTHVQPRHINEALLSGSYVKTDELLQYLQCVFRAYSFQDARGKLNPEAMKARIPAHVDDRTRVEKAIDDCGNVYVPPTSEIAYEFFKCFRRDTQNESYWRRRSI